jgi:NAD(P)-dependent dehydrogenase (short-subunit alcohol dehydrogenase family)
VKAVLITGASTGIGRETALKLASKGFHVFAGVRTEASALELKRIVGEGALALNFETVILDVTKPATIDAAIAKVREKTGEEGLYALINNAGVAIGGPLEVLRIKEVEDVFAVNVFGLLRMTQAALPLLRQAKGRIVNVSSIAGRLAAPGLGAYSASKFAVEALSDSLRRELKRQGISVSVIEPGPIQTPIWEKSLGQSEKTLTDMTAEQKSIYSGFIGKLQERVQENQRMAIPASRVVDAIESALTVVKPRTRYPIGTPMKVATMVAQMAPDVWLDQAMDNGFREKLHNSLKPFENLAGTVNSVRKMVVSRAEKTIFKN